jgi:hypothetical protein
VRVWNFVTLRKEHRPSSRSQRPSACWDRGFESHRGHGCCLVQCLCGQVEVSATGRSLVQRSPTDCGVCLSVIKWQIKTLDTCCEQVGRRGKDCETKHSPRVFENRVMRRIFGPRTEEITGEWRRLHNEELCWFVLFTSYYSDDQMREKW